MKIFEFIKIIKNNYFECFLILCVFIIIILSIYNKIKGNKGKYSKSYYLDTKSQLNSYKKPKKKDSSGEIECRRVLEELYNKKFDKIRPGFLRNDITGGNNLEIDCYNDSMKLGIEYNGQQHYNYIPFFHRTKDTFYNQKYRDDMKRRLCKENNITLIEVPYTIKTKDIKNYLITELKKNNKL